MTIDISVGGGQIVGSRELQEDAFSITHQKDAGPAGKPTLLIVADGIGGQYGGNIASRLAVKSFVEEITNHLARIGNGSVKMPSGNVRGLIANNALARALQYANKKIAAAKARNAQLEPMGSTFVAALIWDAKLWWVSVGDSHLYLIRQRRLERKNARHTYGAELDELAKAGQAVAQASPRDRKRLTSCLDGEEIPRVDCPKIPLRLEAGDVVILASDGLDAVSDGKIVFIATAADSADECAADLLNAVKSVDHPKQDNTTVVVFRYGSVPVQRSRSNDDAEFEKTIPPSD